jgi:hypothetical protein
MVRCGLASHRARCEEDCIAQRPGLVRFSVAGAEALEPCIAHLSCEALRSEPVWDAELDACWEQAQESVAISANARALCVDYAAAWFECGAWWTVEDCEKSYSMWSSKIIEATLACIDPQSCDALRTCSDAAYRTP